jgi:hypothetical protein
MSNFVDNPDLERIKDSELHAVFERITRELLDGVKHGSCEMNIAVERIPSNKTSITVQAGKSWRFVIRFCELRIRDLCD